MSVERARFGSGAGVGDHSFDRNKATEAEQKATEAEQRAEKLAARLQEMEINPEEI